MNMKLHWVPLTASTLMLVVTELFNIAVNEMVSAHAKLFALCIRVLVITELIVSGTQCTHE